MASLIDNILDFARGRLGGGLTLMCSIHGSSQTLLTGGRSATERAPGIDH